MFKFVIYGIHMLIAIGMSMFINKENNSSVPFKYVVLFAFISSTLSIFLFTILALYTPLNALPGGLMEGAIITIPIFIAVFTTLYIVSNILLVLAYKSKISSDNKHNKKINKD